MPARLFHLSRWIAVHVNDPSLAWWVTRQIGLHPRLLAMLAGNVDDSATLSESGRQLWQILLDWLGTPYDHADMQWFRVRRRVQRNGWSSSVLRRFQQATEPIFEVKPPLGIARARPPSAGWKDIDWEQIAHIDVKFVDFRRDQLNIPDEVLPEVFAALQWNLLRGVQRLNECKRRWYHILTLYPEGDDDEDEQYVSSGDGYVLYLVSLLDRMAQTNPDVLRAYIDTWPAPDSNVFDKLRLYALNKPKLFSPEEIAVKILSLDNAAFWNSGHRREFLLLLRDRWSVFSVDKRSQIEARILEGRNKYPHEDANDFEIRRATESAITIGWLIQEACEMCERTLQEWNELKLRLPKWQDEWTQGAARISRGKSGWIATDENASALDGIPVSEITKHALAMMGHAVGEFTEYQPFRGLVKNKPFRAIAALGAASRRGEFPASLWGDAISHWPQTTSSKVKLLLCERMRRLPHGVIVQVRYEVGRWLENTWIVLAQENETYALQLFDDLVSGLLSGGEQGTDSRLGDVFVGGVPVEKSRRTLDHAISGPIGSATRALLSTLAKLEPGQGHCIPHEFSSRFARLLVAPGEGSDQATCILAERINWLDYIAPEWVDKTMIPWFNMEHEQSEPAWNGFFHNNRMPTSSLFKKIKIQFTRLFPIIYSWNWRDHAEERAHELVVWTSVLSSNGYCGISFGEARDCIRNMKSRGHVQIIHCLGQIGRENEDGWAKCTIPFIESAWPKERRVQTERTTKAWVSILEEAGKAFPALLSAVKAYLRRTDSLRFGLYAFTRQEEGGESVAERYPEAMLELLDLVVPDSPADAPHDLAGILDVLMEAKPEIVSDRRFARLEELVTSR